MYGRVCMLETRGLRVRMDGETLRGLPLIRVEIPYPPTDRKMRRAAKLLTWAGVRRVLTPAGFSRWPLLTRRGLEPVETADFCRALAAPLALAALRAEGIAPSEATVALRGERVTRSMRLAALALCPQVRHVSVKAPVGGEGLQAELRREYGVPVLEDRRGRAPDVALHFSRGTGGGEVCFQLWGEPDLAGFRLRLNGEPLPEDCAPLPLLAALWGAGRLDPGEVEILQPAEPVPPPPDGPREAGFAGGET